MKTRRSGGTTLIELVVAILIISTAAATIVGLLAYMSRNSAEALMRTQSTAIAQAYIDMISAQQFDATTDAIMSFNGRTDVGARDRYGAVIANAAQYTVTIAVTQTGLGGIPANDMRRITVTVTDPFSGWMLLTAFRSRHP